MGSSRKKPGKKRARSGLSHSAGTSAKKVKCAKDHLIDAASAMASPINLVQPENDSNTDLDTKSPVSRLDFSEDLDPDTPPWAAKLLKSVNELKQELLSNSSTMAGIQKAVTGIISSNMELVDSVGKLTDQVDVLECERSLLQNENSNLHEKLLLLEFHQRRNNLLFDGIPEAPGYESGKDCYDKIMSCISSVPGLFPEVRVDRCHRLGPKRKFGSRSIIAQFNWYGDVTAILGNKACLPSDAFVSEDFPEEWVNRRRLLRPMWRKARSIPKFKDGAYLSRDKLFIDGKQFTVAPWNNLHELPKEIIPSETCERRDDQTVAFLGPHSVFSNFHQASFIENGVRYVSPEQIIQAEKAALFKDKLSLEQIMLERDPYRIKSLGGRIRNFDKNTWAKESKAIVLHAVSAKFKQNDSLGKLLKCTGSLLIVEASPDKFWGTGQHLLSRDVLQQDSWTSHGQMSEILAEVHSSLKS